MRRSIQMRVLKVGIILLIIYIMLPTGVQSSPPEEEKAKSDKRNYMIVNQTGQELIKKPGEVGGANFKISYLTECTVWLLDNSAQVIE